MLYAVSPVIVEVPNGGAAAYSLDFATNLTRDWGLSF